VPVAQWIERQVADWISAVLMVAYMAPYEAFSISFRGLPFEPSATRALGSVVKSPGLGWVQGGHEIQSTTSYTVPSRKSITTIEPSAPKPEPVARMTTHTHRSWGRP